MEEKSSFTSRKDKNGGTAIDLWLLGKYRDDDHFVEKWNYFEQNDFECYITSNGEIHLRIDAYATSA